MHGDIFVDDVLDDSISWISGVSLQVNSFQRFFHLGVPKGYIFDTIAVIIGRNAANRQADSQANGDIFHKHVLGAVGHLSWGCMGGFGNNHIIIILAGDVEYVNVLACGVDSVGVEREEGDYSSEVVSFENVQLGCGIDFYIQIVESAIQELAGSDVEGGWIFKEQVMDGYSFAIVDGYEVGPASARGHILFWDPPGIEPPDVPSSIYFASPSDCYICAVEDIKEVGVHHTIALRIFVFWIIFDAVAGHPFSPDFEHKIIFIFNGNWHGVELFVRDYDYPFIPFRWWVAGFINGAFNGLFVGDLGWECVLVGDGSEMEDILNSEGTGQDEQQR